MYKRFILPSAFLAAMIIGAGIFSLPYVFASAGLPAGFFYLFFFAAVFAVIHVSYADVIVRTPQRHRFVGYASIYLGKSGFWLAIFTTLVGLILAAMIYLVLSVSFLKLVAPNLPVFWAVSLFWFVASAPVFLYIGRFAKAESLIAAAMILIIAAIFLYGLAKGNQNIDYFSIHPAFILLPFGPVLFSLGGRAAISSVVEYFDGNRYPYALLKKSMIAGTVIPAVTYAFFVLGVLFISPTASEDAVSGLVNNAPQLLLAAIGVLGLFSLASSYSIIAKEIEGILFSDFRLPQFAAVLTAVALPLLLYFAGLQNFLRLVSAAGGIFLALESILVLMIWRAVKTPPLLIRRIHPVVLYGIILIFIGGMIYEIIKLL